MRALLFLCWLGLAAIVLSLIVAGLEAYRETKCPDHLPDDWTMNPPSERPGE